MTMRPLHVERTDDPAVLRWVCHGERHARFEPRPSSPLGSLLAQGFVADVRSDGGDLFVTIAPETTWDAGSVRVVHDAIAAELETGRCWLPALPDQPAIADVQAVVDRAVGAITTEHGGRIEVVDVTPPVVTVELHGSCSGCSSSDTTVTGTAERAVVQMYPELSAMRTASVGPRLRVRRRRSASTGIAAR